MPDDDEEPRPRRRNRQAARDEVGHGTSAFMTMFGGSVGCAAGCGFVFLCLVVFTAFMASRGDRHEPTSDPVFTPEKQPEKKIIRVT